MRAILFYVEEDTQIPNQRMMIDQWCAMAGLTHIMIDKTQKMKKTNKNVFWTIQEAIDAYPDHKFVFMEQMANTKHTEFKYPIDDVIYCVGSDDDGFQGFDLTSYQTLTLDNKRTKEESGYYASSIVPILIADILRRS